MKKTTLVFAGLILFTILLMACMPRAGASYQNHLNIECGQEYILVENDGYKEYEAWLTWTDTYRGLELTSMVAKYWNGVKTVNSKIGFTDNRESMFSPLTCTQLESKKFGAYVSIPTTKVEEETKLELLEIKYEKLKTQFASMVEEATKKAIENILDNL